MKVSLAALSPARAQKSARDLAQLKKDFDQLTWSDQLDFLRYTIAYITRLIQ